MAVLVVGTTVVVVDAGEDGDGVVPQAASARAEAAASKAMRMGSSGCRVWPATVTTDTFMFNENGGDPSPALAAGPQLARHRVASHAELERGFGAAAVGELQRDFQQGMVEAFARFRMQAFGALVQTVT